MKFQTLSHLALLTVISASFTACNGKNSSGVSSLAPAPTQEPVTKQAETKEEAPKVQRVPGETDISISRTVELLEDLSNLNEFKTQLNKRNIKAIYNGNAQDKLKLQCKVNGSKVNHEVLFEENFETREIEAEFEVVLGDGVSENPAYHCDIVDGQEIKFKKSVVLKRDVILERKEGKHSYTLSELKLNSNSAINLGALIIEDASLITGGARVELKVDEFVGVGNANLETFSAEQVNAGAGQIGRDGGRIAISAQKSFGELEVYLRGMNAGEYGAVENSYETFSIPYSECDYGSYSRTYNFPRTGKAGLKGGNSGILDIAAYDHQMDVAVFKIPGKGGQGQVSTNPVSSITINFYHAPNAIGLYAWAEPHVGRDVDGTWTQHNPTYTAHGKVCNSKFLYHFKNRWAVFAYVTTDIVQKKSLASLALDQAKRLQSGPAGVDGQEEAATVYDEMKKRTQNF